MQLFQGKPCHHACHAFLSLFLILSACQSQKSQNREEDKSAAAAQADSVQHQRHAILLHDHDGNDYDPALEAANFIATIDHPYFNLLPGRVWTYEGKDEDGEVDRVEIEVTSDTKVILGVTTTVVREREWKNGELEEDTFDWFAQDREAMFGILVKTPKKLMTAKSPAPKAPGRRERRAPSRASS